MSGKIWLLCSICICLLDFQIEAMNTNHIASLVQSQHQKRPFWLTNWINNDYHDYYGKLINKIELD